MKNGILFVLLTLIQQVCAQQEVIGDWTGKLTIPGFSLRINFHITQKNNVLTATMDSPDQGAVGIPVDQVTFVDGVLNLSVAAAGLSYTAKPETGKLIGKLKQGGQELELNLEPISSKTAQGVERPQQPKKPLSYFTEDLKIEHVKAGVTLAGTLSAPNKKGKYPLLILISGSGPQNRNEEIMGHQPFAVLADYFTKEGMAVFRYDDRGVAESKGNFGGATSFDFAEDVKAIVRFFKDNKHVDAERILLVGHSEGGLIAPMVAAEINDLAGLVLLAGTGLDGKTILLHQQRLIGEKMGVDKNQLDIAEKLNRALYEEIQRGGTRQEIKNNLTAKVKVLLTDLKPSPIPEGQTEEDWINALSEELLEPWMMNFIQIQPQTYLSQTKCPVLAINGSKDVQVLADENLEAIQKALIAGGNQRVTIKKLEGLNHLFQHADSGLPQEYGAISETFSVEAMAVISNWLKENKIMN